MITKHCPINLAYKPPFAMPPPERGYLSRTGHMGGGLINQIIRYCITYLTSALVADGFPAAFSIHCLLVRAIEPANLLPF
jgi:hypothetical protein